MMNLSEYVDMDAVGLADLIRKGEVSAAEVVETAIAAARQIDPALNFVAHNLAESARAEVSRLVGDAPFAGVPFMVKDLSLDMAGAPNEAGSRLLAGNVARGDHNLMARFRAAGLITIARTTTAEFGAQLTTESRLTGVTRNPWSPDHTAGGSSGGSSAAVAAGVVPVAHANDGIGSIRGPASNCGVFGLKLTRQRTPSGPDFGETIGGRGSEFVVSRTVRDSAAMLDAVHGPDVGAPCWAPPPRRPYREELTAPSPPLRIALMTRAFSGAAVDPACEAAVLEAAHACEALGHAVEEAAPVFDWRAYRRAIRTEAFANFSAGMSYFGGLMGRPVDETTLEPLNLLAFQEGARVTTGEYLTSIAAYGRVQRDMGAFFERWDVLLTPVLARPPARIGTLGADPTDLETYWDEFSGDAYSPFTGVFNVTGHPAASIPLSTSGGLPLGAHVVGRFGEEGTLINLAAQLERAHPWIGRRPPIWAGADEAT